ncbi:MAG: hypothetical protein NZ108_09110, partial [Bacteroidia bacterium]|nr:hypothetical protein [Bacteroidia bacterium]
ILAYSTISQLGIMVAAIGSGVWQASFLHLITHAFFKCGLFLGAASIIHALHSAYHHFQVHDDPQDIRLMGGLRNVLPHTFRTFSLTAAALMGIPLTAGFLSKDAILAGILSKAFLQPIYFVVVFLVWITSVFTAFYVLRQWLLIFAGNNRWLEVMSEIKDSEWRQVFHDSDKRMLIPLYTLGIACIGFIFAWNPFDAMSSWLVGQMSVPISSVTVNHSAHLLAIGLSISAILIGTGTAWYFYRKSPVVLLQPANGIFFQLSRNRLYLDTIYQTIFIEPFLWISGLIAKLDSQVIDVCIHQVASLVTSSSVTGLPETKHQIDPITGLPSRPGLSRWISWLDTYWVDGLVNSLISGIVRLSSWIKKLQNGKIQFYLSLSLLLWLILVFVFMIR